MKLKLKQSLLFLLALVILISLSFKVLAAPDISNIADIIGKIDFIGIYYKAPSAFDGMIYLLIFISVAHSVLGKTFQGRAGRLITVGIGLALSFSLAFWANSRNPPFILGRLGPLAGVLIIIIIGLAAYRFVTKNREIGLAFSIGLAIFAITLNTSFPWLKEFLLSFEIGKIIYGFINVLGVIAIIMFFRNFSRGSSGRSSRRTNYRTPSIRLGREGNRLRRDRRRLRGNERNLEREERETDNRRAREYEERIRRLAIGVDREIGILRRNMDSLRTTLTELQDLVNDEAANPDLVLAKRQQLAQSKSFATVIISRIERGIADIRILIGRSRAEYLVMESSDEILASLSEVEAEITGIKRELMAIPNNEQT